MSLLSSRIQSIASRNYGIGAGRALRYYSKTPRILPPLATHPHHSRLFFYSCSSSVANDPSSTKEAVAQTGAEAPPIKEKLPDPDRTPFRFREFDLEGKVFVVTGGGRGLGLVLAEALIEGGGKGQPSRCLPVHPPMKSCLTPLL